MKTDHKYTDTTDNTDLNPAFGEWLRGERELLGITQDEMAKAGGINRKLVGEIERRGYIPKRSTLLDIAAALGTPNEIMLCAAGFSDRKWPTEAIRRFLYIQLELLDTNDLLFVRSLVASLRVWRNQQPPQMGNTSKRKAKPYDQELPGAETFPSVEDALKILQAVIGTLPKQQRDRATLAYKEIQRLLPSDTEVQQGELHARHSFRKYNKKEND